MLFAQLFGYPLPVALLALAGVAGIGYALYKRDSAVEQRRKNAIQIGRELSDEGLDHIPLILDDYAVGDYSNMASRIGTWHEFLRNGENRKAFLNGFLKKQLDRALDDPERRAYVLDRVKQFQAKQAAADAETLERIKQTEAVKS